MPHQARKRRAIACRVDRGELAINGLAAEGLHARLIHEGGIERPRLALERRGICVGMRCFQQIVHLRSNRIGLQDSQRDDRLIRRDLGTREPRAGRVAIEILARPHRRVHRREI